MATFKELLEDADKRGRDEHHVSPYELTVAASHDRGRKSPKSSDLSFTAEDFEEKSLLKDAVKLKVPVDASVMPQPFVIATNSSETGSW